MAFCTFYLLAAFASGSVLTVHTQFDQPDLQNGIHGLKVTLPGSPLIGHPGEPLLPKSSLRLLIPFGERVVGLEVLPLTTHMLIEGVSPEVAQAPRPASLGGPVLRTMARAEIYQGDHDWPSNPLISWREDIYRGYRILSLVLSPLSFEGKSGRLNLIRDLEIRVSTEADDELRSKSESMLRSDADTRARVNSIVENPHMLESYLQLDQGRESDRDFDDLDYLILGTERWAPQMDEYVEFLKTRGYRAKYFTRSWVASQFEGRDEPELIRNFIKQVYQESDIEYLLIVGDARDEDGIPHRGLFCQSYSTTDYDLPADIYYGALDGDWNSDGDGRWGEPGEADLFPELAVGRACVSDEEGLANFIRKQMLYQEAPVVDKVNRALMLGEKLWDNPLTWGGSYKDEIWHGSENNGLSTAGLPASMAVGSLYERDWVWQKEHLVVILRDGVGIVNHQGHAYYNLAAKIHNNDLPQLDNDGVTDAIGFFYSQGCYCGSFDDKASYGGYQSDCFGERVTTQYGGFAAAVMNSRYGWGNAGGTAGPSQYFDREFFDALFGEQIFEVGMANDDSKMDLAWMVDYPGMRWCLYDLNLFGDPAMEIWTGTPRSLQITQLEGLKKNSHDVSLRVVSGLAPVPGARVTLYRADMEILEVVTTNISGQAFIETEPLEEGRYTLTAWRHNYVAHRSKHDIKLGDLPGEEPSDQEGNRGNDSEDAWVSPRVFALQGNLPNPFNPSTTISFTSLGDGPLGLNIFDVEGRRVRSLIDARHFDAGLHSVEWDGRDERDRELGSGVYFMVLTSGNASDTGKMLLLK
jgi:hypothetical protein